MLRHYSEWDSTDGKHGENGQLVYEIPRKSFIRRKFVGVGYAALFPVWLVLLVILVTLGPELQTPSTLLPIALSGAIILGATFLFFRRGLEMNHFGITTEGIFPLVKPLRKIFFGRYFLPYSSIQEVKTQYSSFSTREGKILQDHPRIAELLLKNSDKITIGVISGSSPLYLYLWSEKDFRCIFRLIEVIKQHMSEQRNGSSRDVAIPAELLQGALGERETCLYRNKTKRELLQILGEVVLTASAGVLLVAMGLSSGFWILSVMGITMCFFSFLLGYSRLP